MRICGVWTEVNPLEPAQGPSGKTRNHRHLAKAEASARHVDKARRTSHPAIVLLESWLAGDAEEQAQTWAYLEESLDRDRLSDRRLLSLETDRL